MMVTARVVWLLTFVLCCAALGFAQNTNPTNAVATTGLNPILLIGGGVALVLAGLVVGFAIGRSSAKKN
jgi:hypothetical protein